MKETQEQSDVEKFFYVIRAKMHGELNWEDLSPIDQMRFVDALNVILQLTSARFANDNKPL